MTRTQRDQRRGKGIPGPSLHFLRTELIRNGTSFPSTFPCHLSLAANAFQNEVNLAQLSSENPALPEDVFLKTPHMWADAGRCRLPTPRVLAWSSLHGCNGAVAISTQPLSEASRLPSSVQKSPGTWVPTLELLSTEFSSLVIV